MKLYKNSHGYRLKIAFSILSSLDTRFFVSIKIFIIRPIFLRTNCEIFSKHLLLFQGVHFYTQVKTITQLWRSGDAGDIASSTAMPTMQ